MHRRAKPAAAYTGRVIVIGALPFWFPVCVITYTDTATFAPGCITLGWSSLVRAGSLPAGEERGEAE